MSADTRLVHPVFLPRRKVLDIFFVLESDPHIVHVDVMSAQMVDVIADGWPGFDSSVALAAQRSVSQAPNCTAMSFSSNPTVDFLCVVP